MGKVATLDELLKEVEPLRGSQRLVFTNGCFDLLHVGHIQYLKDAKNQGDLLIIGLNADASIKRLKGPERPLQCEEDRAEILSSLNMVDYVILFSEDTPENLIKAISPDVLVKGGDWPVEKIVGSDYVLSKGGEVKSLKFVEGHSTSHLVEKIKTL